MYQSKKYSLMSLTQTYSHATTIAIMIQNISIMPQSPFVTPYSQFSSLSSFLISLLSVMILLYVEFHINGFYPMYFLVSDFFHLVSFFSDHPVLVYFSTSIFLLLSSSLWYR